MTRLPNVHIHSLAQKFRLKKRKEMIQRPRSRSLGIMKFNRPPGVLCTERLQPAHRESWSNLGKFGPHPCRARQPGTLLLSFLAS